MNPDIDNVAEYGHQIYCTALQPVRDADGIDELISGCRTWLSRLEMTHFDNEPSATVRSLSVEFASHWLKTLEVFRPYAWKSNDMEIFVGLTMAIGMIGHQEDIEDARSLAANVDGTFRKLVADTTEHKKEQEIGLIAMASSTPETDPVLAQAQNRLTEGIRNSVNRYNAMLTILTEMIALNAVGIKILDITGLP